MSVSCRAVLAALALSCCFGARSASAYDLTTSSTGAPVHWTTDEITFVPALTPSPMELDPAAALATTTASLEAWDAAMPADRSVALGAAAAAAPRAIDGINMIRWALAPDDPDVEPGLLARTFVSFQSSDGELVDADIVLNAAEFTWTTRSGACTNEYDLGSALSHELGHALGLAHAIGHPEATMFATGDACDQTKRDLAPDDVAGVAALYGPGDVAAAGGCSSTKAPGALPGLLVLAGLLSRRRRRVAALAAVVLGVAGSASAAGLRRMAPPELAARAAVVVRGHVVAQATRRAGADVVTESTIVVEACLLGPCGPTVVVRRLGGELDGLGVHVDGEAALATGDEVLLYLRRDGAQNLRVLGGVQGAWRIERGGGRIRAVRDLRGHAVQVDGRWQRGGLEAVDLVDASAAPPR